ncbi:MAG: F0F1 ATP synthase subunit alpha, partial [Bacteroidales bacterium]|nr:F0F1 ATP synthase subunit alpha [Bacteroidales bacterium]
QLQYSPMPVEQQVAILYCGTHGLLRNVPIDKVHTFEKSFVTTLVQRHNEDVLQMLKKGVINEEVTNILEKVAADVVAGI